MPKARTQKGAAMPSELPPPCLRVAQVAAHLGVDTATVYRLIRSREIGHYRISQSYRIGRHHLTDFLERVERCARVDRENSGSNAVEPAGARAEREEDSLNHFRLQRRIRAMLEKDEARRKGDASRKED